MRSLRYSVPALLLGVMTLPAAADPQSPPRRGPIALPPLPAGATRPAAAPVASRPAAAASAPAPAPARPPAPAHPALDASGARIQLQAMSVAANEMTLAPDVRTALAGRVRQAQQEVSAIAARAGNSSAAASYEQVLARARADAAALLKDKANAFALKSASVADEAQSWARPEAGGIRRMIDLLLQPKPEQQVAIDRIVTETARQRADAVAAPEPTRSERLEQAGFAARAAVRALLTPAQLADWDDLLTRSAARIIAARSPQVAAGSATTHPTTQASDTEAESFARFETMLLAAQEGPYTPEQKTRLIDRIKKARADMAAVVPEQKAKLAERINKARSGQAVPAAGDEQDSPLKQIDALRKNLSLDIVDILSGKADDFDRRRDHIAGELVALRSASLPLDHVWISDPANDLKLTNEQKAQIDKLLADRVEKLKQVDREAAPDDSPAVVRMRKEQIALATRAAIRATLTPKQLQDLDRLVAAGS